MSTKKSFVVGSLRACWSACHDILENGMLCLTYRLSAWGACNMAVGTKETFSSEKQYFHFWVTFNSDDSEYFATTTTTTKPS